MSEGPSARLGQNDGAADGCGHLLGALDAQAHVAVGVAHHHERLQHQITVARFTVTRTLLSSRHFEQVGAGGLALHKHQVDGYRGTGHAAALQHACEQHASGWTGRLAGRADLEARPLPGACLLLHRHDLHDLVLEGAAEEELHDLVLLDRHGEEEDVLQLLDLALQHSAVMSSAVKEPQLVPCCTELCGAIPGARNHTFPVNCVH